MSFPYLLDHYNITKMAPDVMKGNIIPWVDFTPKWLGWRSLGLSPETIGIRSTVEEFLKRFWNSLYFGCSSILAVGLGSCAAMVCPASIIALVL